MTTDISHAVADLALGAAIRRYQTAKADTDRLTLLAMALLVREQYPDAVDIVLDFSDQGDFMAFDEVLDSAGDRVQPLDQKLSTVDIRVADLLDGYAMNLDRGGTWLAFRIDNPERNVVHVDVQKILDHEGDWQQAVAAAKKEAGST